MKQFIFAALLFSAANLVSCDKNTDDGETPNPDPTPKADLELVMDRTTKVLYYGDRKNAGTYNYFFGLGDAEFIKDEQGDDAAPEGGHIIFFDLFSTEGAESFETAVLPDGTYTLAGTDAAGTLNNYYTRMQIYDNGTQRSVDFTEGSLTVKSGSNGKSLEALFTLADGSTVSCTYEGELVFGDPDAGAGGEDVPTLKEPIDETFTDVVGIYCGDEYNSGTDMFQIGFSNVPLDNDGIMTAAGYSIVLMMYTEPCGSFIYLPEGTYNVSDSYAAGTVEPGGLFMDIYGSYCAKVDANGNAEELGLIAGGTVTVTESGWGYKFVFDLTTAEGVAVKGTFDGEIDFIDMSPVEESNTTLTSDYVLDLSNADKVSLDYYGDYYGNGLANWVLSIYDSDGDGIDIELITAATSTTEIPLPEKQYNMSVDNGIGFVMGESSVFGMMGTWYTDLSTLDNDGYVYGYAAAIDGWVKLSKEDDTTNVSFEFVDESWNLFSGSWSGKLPAATDNSSLVSSMSVSKAARSAFHIRKADKRRAATDIAKRFPTKKMYR